MSGICETRLNVLFLEPFYGGSHRAFADGLARYSRHRIEIHSLPARFWKWRMRGAALHFAREIDHPEKFDLLVCSDMMGVLELKGLWQHTMPPTMLYFHENQLSYPVPEGERLDYHFACTNLTSTIAADRIVFNSQVHRDAFFSELGRFLRRLPEYRPGWAIDEARKKSTVIYPGCSLPPTHAKKDRLPLVIWNHRWEFDKQPELFFDTLKRVARRGIVFRLALLGENFQAVPKPFLEAREEWGDRIVQYGYVEDPDTYRHILARGWVVVSTAIQENFGISVVEAVHAGCLPLLPRRLSYPEIVPAEFHDQVLYDDEFDLEERLASILTGEAPPENSPLSNAMNRYAWETIAREFDAEMETLAG